MGKLNSPKARLAEIEFLVFVTAFLLVFLAAFGTRRRRSRSGFLKAMLWVTSTSATYLIAYIFGLMQDAPFKDKLFPLWGMLLLIAFAFPDSFSIYSLDEIEQWRRYYWQFLAKIVGFYVLYYWTIRFNWAFNLESQLFGFFTLIVFIKFITRLLSLIWVSPSSIEERAKFFEIYTNYEHHLPDQNTIDPRTMRGYRYLVAAIGDPDFSSEDVHILTESGLEKLQQRKDVVTLEDVWSCRGRLLTSSGDPNNKLKDTCLSLSLLRILLLKSAGYSLPMEAQEKMWRLFRDGLLPDGDRAFRAIEGELKLLYEFSYTKYPVYTFSFFSVLRSIEFLLSLIVYGLAAAYMSKYANSLEGVELGKLWGHNLDVLVTYILLGMLFLADIVQLVMIASSEWVKAAFIFTYVAKDSWQDNEFLNKLIEMICNIQFSKPWAGMLGQYSLIESQDYGTEYSIIQIAGTTFLDWNRDGQRERKAISLSDEVKKGVLDCLRNDEPKLENGRASLRRNRVNENLLRACDGGHEAEVILVWHIATGYFQHKSSSFPSSSINCRIVSDLSSYLAYLVCFAPRLLPGPPFDPQFHFRRTMAEARKAFKDCKTVESKIHKLDNLAEEEGRGIIIRGARLGKQLLQLQEEGCEDTVWKILAEFWSEMALCVATSDNVNMHVEKLASGGEFITHLWVLRHHTGITSAHPASAV